MSWESKVLWTEGLFLQPHHFQQADRYSEALVAGLAQRLTPYGWGVSSLEIDDQALKVGQFRLKGCAGLTQDGAVFRIPQTDDLPPRSMCQTVSRIASSICRFRHGDRVRPR